MSVFALLSLELVGSADAAGLNKAAAAVGAAVSQRAPMAMSASSTTAPVQAKRGLNKKPSP
jgi:hypothetical protein